MAVSYKIYLYWTGEAKIQTDEAGGRSRKALKLCSPQIVFYDDSGDIGELYLQRLHTCAFALEVPIENEGRTLKTYSDSDLGAVVPGTKAYVRKTRDGYQLCLHVSAVGLVQRPVYGRQFDEKTGLLQLFAEWDLPEKWCSSVKEMKEHPIKQILFINAKEAMYRLEEFGKKVNALGNTRSLGKYIEAEKEAREAMLEWSAMIAFYKNYTAHDYLHDMATGKTYPTEYKEEED